MGALLSVAVETKLVTHCLMGRYALTAVEMHGARSSMEDETILHKDLKPGEHLIVVLDGHGGGAASKFAQSQLPTLLGEMEEPLTAEKVALSLMGVDMLLKSTLPHNKSGSAVAGILLSNDKVLVFHAGDSRVIIFDESTSEIVHATQDHKPMDQEEEKRIIAAGGHVTMGRVGGRLALSRGLGDHVFKQRADLPWDQQQVTAAPVCTTVKLTSPSQSILVCCDGLLEKLENEDLVRYLCRARQQGKDVISTMAGLLDVAFGSGSTDNMSAVYIRTCSQADSELSEERQQQIIVDDTTIAERHAEGKTMPDEWISAKRDFLQRSRHAINHTEVLRNMNAGLMTKSRVDEPINMEVDEHALTPVLNTYNEDEGDGVLATSAQVLQWPLSNPGRLMIADGHTPRNEDAVVSTHRPLNLDALVAQGLVEFVSREEYEAHHTVVTSLDRPDPRRRFEQVKLHPSLLMGTSVSRQPNSEEPSTLHPPVSTQLPSYEHVMLNDVLAECAICTVCTKELFHGGAHKCRYCKGQYVLCTDCFAQTASSHTHFGLPPEQVFFERHMWLGKGDDKSSFDKWPSSSSFNDIWMQAFKRFPRRDALLHCVATHNHNHPPTKWLTYADVMVGVCAAAEHLDRWKSRHRMASRSSGQKNRQQLCDCNPPVLMLIEPNSVAWVCVFLACLARHIVVVAVDVANTDTERQAILDHIRPDVVVGRSETLRTLHTSSSVPQLDLSDFGIEEAVTSNGGRMHSKTLTLLHPTTSACVVALSMTSGTTGLLPKAVVVTDGMLRSKTGAEASAVESDLTLASFVSFSNSTGRGQLLRCLCIGGRVGIVSSPTALFAELDQIRPTLLSAPPSIWQVAYQRHQQLMSSQGHTEAQAFERIRAWLGGNLSRVTIGGAKVDPQLLRFLQACFGKGHAFEGYGASEVGMIARNGVVFPDVDVRLRDVPELGFLSTDKPYPRGEICVVSPEVTPGYFGGGSSSSCDLAFIEMDDGKRYYCTGDIGQLVSTGNQARWGVSQRIEIIDRVKHCFKTASGKFIAPEVLETKLEMHAASWMSAVFLYPREGDGQMSAVIVPKEMTLPPTDPIELLRRLQAVARDQLQFSNEEIPQYLQIVSDASEHASWYTATGKKRRRVLHQRYAATASITNKDVCPSSGIDQEDVFDRVIQHHLPNLPANWLQCTFVECGGTSIDAMKLAAVLNTSPSCGSIQPRSFYEASTLAEVRALWKGQGKSQAQAQAPSHNSITTQMRTDHTELRFTLGGERGDPNHVLLTGATGFLGRFLLHAFLQTHASVRVTCLVRGANDADATDRLLQIMRSDVGWAASTKLPSTVRVWAISDLATDQCGLTAERFADVSSSCGVVVHAAAEVHFWKTYSDLRAVNVLSTTRLMQMCKHKRFVLVSTASVNHWCDRHQGLDQWQGAGGYVQSKLVAEHLASVHASQSTQPWQVVRPVAITGKPISTHGTPPPGDWLWNMLQEVIRTSVLPIVPAGGMGRDDGSGGALVPCTLGEVWPELFSIAGMSEQLRLIPVEVAAQAITVIALREHYTCSWTNVALPVTRTTPLQVVQQLLPASTPVRLLSEWKDDAMSQHVSIYRSHWLEAMQTGVHHKIRLY